MLNIFANMLFIHVSNLLPSLGLGMYFSLKHRNPATQTKPPTCYKSVPDCDEAQLKIK